ncbi:hypothetical protein OGH69_00825 [Flavobacterium sp. MFBS3-15]|uniref:hypothetical protein n=1 Tax=Flavobacterium sp. MFBS3-15 TaxID=2989816 RepID=UPI0022361DD3|nr:hypothetical protein [Flavobacterium sp. MFBS3-15]MCW4467497.1 hypothetical protein [Flavobacterium sp. MFBS3-15]
MKIKHLLGGAFFATMSLNSQTIEILNYSSNEPVHFASVIFYKENKTVTGDYANENGILNFQYRDFDCIEISCIGFETKKFDKKNITEKLYLKETVIQLPEIIVNGKASVEIGYINKKKVKLKRNLSIGKFIQIAEFIENPFKVPVLIKSFSFKLIEVRGRPIYRLHLYRKHETENIPGEDILTKDLVYSLDEEAKGLVELDLAEYGVELPPDGIYIALEGLGSYDKNGNPDENGGFDFEMFLTDEYIHLYKYEFFDGPEGWINRNEQLKKDEEFMGRKIWKKSFIAPCFGLKVQQP